MVVTTLAVGFMILSGLATVAVLCACVLSGRADDAIENPYGQVEPKAPVCPSPIRRMAH